MALQIEWTERSIDQLLEILNYWELRNGSRIYSLKLYQIILEAVEVLSKYPESGQLTDNSKLRKKTVKDYFIYYTIDESHLTVIAISDMRRSKEFLDTLEV